VSRVPFTTNEEFRAAVSAAKQAFPAWRNTPITTRQRVMLKLQELIRRDIVSMLEFFVIVAFYLYYFLIGFV
jgi:acyl-CoA reductase-like NAD-dependent aldehyde dehydrogenase